MPDGTGQRQTHVARAIDMLRHAEDLEQYIPVFEEDLSNISRLLNLVTDSEQDKEADTSWDVLYDWVHELSFSRLPRAGKNADKQKQEIVKKIRDTVKEIINKKIKERLITDKSYNIIRDFQEVYPVISCLGRLVNEFTAL